MDRSKSISLPFWKTILFSLLFLLSPMAAGQVDPDIGTYVGDYAKKISASREMSALDENLFGDMINHYTGRTDFSVTDVSLPGNSALPVAFARRYQLDRWVAPGENGHRPSWKLGPLSDWDIDLPYMHGRFPLSPQYSPRLGWQTSTAGMRCSQPSKSHAAPTVTSGYVPEDFWFGNSLYIPGKGDQELLFVESPAQRKAQGAFTYRWATKDGWYFSCLPTTANGVEGEGFLAHAPDGTRYWFNQFAGTVRAGEAANKRDGLRSGEVRILLTRVEDRFGNYVVYEYAADSDAKLLSITANDGRRLTMTYAGPHIKTVSDGVRIWTYIYGDWQTGIVDDQNGFLWHVQQPDGAKWNYTTVYAPGLVELDSTECGIPSTWLANVEMVFNATHPSGAHGKFVFNMRRHGRTHAPKACKKFTVAPYTVNEYIPLNFATVSLSRKEISGPGLPTKIWQWNYQQVAGRYDYECVSGNCPTSKLVTLSKPDGTFSRNRFGIQYGVNDGLLLSSEQIDADGVTVLSRRDNSYQLSPLAQNYEPGYGSTFRQYADPRVSYQQPSISVLVSRGGDTYEWRIPQCGSVRCLDDLIRPIRIERVSSLGYSRSDSVEYHDDLVAWITGQVRKRINLDTAVVEFEAGFNAQSLPAWINRFGRTQQSATYNSDGTVATISDGRNNVTAVSNWKRGIPQLIRHPPTPEAPEGATESATVNDNGWITSVTDAVGSVTGYGYDAMGRLASIIQPTGDGVAYHTTYRSFQPIAANDWKPQGLSVGQWRLTEVTGHRTAITYMDALWRPVLSHEYDGQNVAATLRASKTAYDTSGRVSFQSYPSSQTIPGDTGTRTFYDALGRVTRVEQDSEHGALVTTTQYLSGLKTRVTNPKGFSTTTSFMAWDQPAYDFPTLSEQPEGKVIQIGRHPQFGWPQQLTQRNAANTLSVTRRYVYDGHAQLCKTIEPETGVTVMDYDGAGNLAWQAAGLDASSGSYNSLSDCQRVAANSSGRAVNRTYDPRNRLTHLTFPNGLGNQIWTYEKDNLPSSVTAYNDAGSTAPVVTSYTYNKRRLLSGETLAQPGWYSWSVGYAYDGYGHLSTQTYPTGLVVDYAPNPLGQPTKAGTFATGAQYYPNGALKQFTYGNGIVHTMTQNARQLPERTTSSGGVLDFHNFYDLNGNLEHIANRVVEGYDLRDRWMEYDQLDRLTAAGSGSFGGDHWHRMTYDALDNLKSWKLAGVKDYAEYVYDAQNRLTSIRNTAGATVQGLQYDPQGNLQNKNGQVYQFDLGNRLRIVNLKETYRYDGLGRRVMSWRWPQPGASTGTLSFSMYSQNGQIPYEEDHHGTPTTAKENIYLAGSVIATRENKWGVSVAVKYQHTDALGSPVAVTNETGQVIERMDYEPWGAIIGKPNHNGIGYTGHVMDGATGLTYMQQRYYDQSIGRFLSVDPVTADRKTGVNFNRYWYADNNPYIYKDPDGRARCGVMNMGSDACDLPSSILASGAGFNKAMAAGLARVQTLETIEVRVPRQPMQPTVAPVRPGLSFGAVGAILSRLWGPALLLWPTEIAAPACEMPGGPPCGVYNESEPSETDLTKVKERDGNKVAQDAGYDDAHDAKKGRGEGGVDIYRDKSGRYWLWNGVPGGEKEPL
jgi:RHS repeat-associated protein